MKLLKQSTATSVIVGQLLDANGAAVTTAVVGDFGIGKNGSYATLSGATVTHIGNGYYSIALTTGNTDTVGRLVLYAVNTSYGMATHHWTVLLASVFDAILTNATNTTGGLATATAAISAFAGAISTLTAAGVRTELTTELGRIDVATSTRMATYTQPTGFLAATFPTTVSSLTAAGVRTELATELGRIDVAVSSRSSHSAADVWSVATRTLTAFGFSVTVGTNNDKTGYNLTAGTGLGNQTANITGSLSGSVGSVSGSVGSISGVTFPANFGSLLINISGHVSRVVLVDTTTTNTDMRGTDNAALASAWTATRAGYLDSVLLAQNANQRTVQVTGGGSGHIAADVHAMQDDVLTASALAADAVTEIQSGLATAANLLIVSDRVSYGLAVLVGACSDAQTAAETYTLSIGGNTFTVDYSGLDASGNRSTTTLSKA